MHRSSLLPVVMLIGVALGGCVHHAESSLLSEDFEPATKPVPAALIYGDLWNPNGGTRVYLREARDESESAIHEHAGPNPENNAFAMARDLVRREGPPVPMSVRWLSVESGSVVLLRTQNLERGIELVFDPPLVLCPTTLASQHTSSTNVREVESGKTGRADWTLELLGERILPTGDTELLLRSILEIRLGSSTVRRRTDRIIQNTNSGSGEPLHEETWETVLVFGFTVSSKSETLRTKPD
ncbi:MAG: hypothetical protein ACIAQF_05845 [Phycisphaerales bacterium JB065]